MRTLKFFQIDTNRDLLYPDVACYQMDLRNAVNQAIEAGLVEGDMAELPSWQKFQKHPVKAKGFFTNMLKSVFMGTGNHDELNVEYQTGNIIERRVAMMFFPDNTKKTNLDKIGALAQQALPNFEVIILNGNTTTQKKAQRKVKEAMYLNPDKSILIISAKMGQRSFSIGEIDELYLAYDSGDNGATIQKMSRALTPNTLDKVGRIFSLSFDPNRDDKFDQLLIQTALNQAQRNPSETDIRAELANILRTVDIFTCTEDGAIPIVVDDFVEEAMSRKSITRVMGKVADLGSIPNDYMEALANGDIDYIKNKERERSEKGNTYKEPQQRGGGGNENEEEIDDTPNQVRNATIEQVREMVTTIIEHSDILVYGSNTTNIREALKWIKSENEEHIIEEEFGVSFEVVEWLFEKNIIKQEWINILYKL